MNRNISKSDNLERHNFAFFHIYIYSFLVPSVCQCQTSLNLVQSRPLLTKLKNITLPCFHTSIHPFPYSITNAIRISLLSWRARIAAGGGVKLQRSHSLTNLPNQHKVLNKNSEHRHIGRSDFFFRLSGGVKEYKRDAK